MCTYTHHAYIGRIPIPAPLSLHTDRLEMHVFYQQCLMCMVAVITLVTLIEHTLEHQLLTATGVNTGQRLVTVEFPKLRKSHGHDHEAYKDADDVGRNDSST